MRKNHLEYLKGLVDSIVFEVEKKDFFPFKDRFIEIQPGENEIIEMFPCCVLAESRVVHKMEKDNGMKSRLSPIVRDGIKYLRTLQRLYEQEYYYNLEFWIVSPEYEILSESTIPGIIDQACIYIAKNRKIQSQITDSVLVSEIEARESNTQTGSVKDKNVYRFSLKIVILDGIYELIEEKTIGHDRAKLEIKQPVDIKRK